MDERTCSNLGCNEPVDSRGRCKRHYEQWRLSDEGRKVVRHPDQRPALVRFWSNVDQSGDCWTWTGTVDEDGYGKFNTRAGGIRYWNTHRFSFWLATGIHPGRLWVLHHCDNPPCVRPDHLFLGDAAANNADMTAKGRERYPSGDDHYARLNPDIVRHGDDSPFVRISDAAVDDIRRRWASGGITQAALAAEYGISPALASLICAGKRRGRPGTKARAS